MFGGQGNDDVYGEDGDDDLGGDLGDDNLYGGTGNDRLLGGSGFDILNGGSGADTLDGGAWDDVLYGDFGADSFVVRNNSARDTIVDLNFEDGDRVLMERNINGSGIFDFDDLIDRAYDHRGGVGFDLGGGNTLVIGNQPPDQFLPQDFVFF